MGFNATFYYSLVISMQPPLFLLENGVPNDAVRSATIHWQTLLRMDTESVHIGMCDYIGKWWIINLTTIMSPTISP